MLYLIGLGLGDTKDITVKGLEAIKSSSKVFLEAYTSILTVGKEELEKFYGKELIIADREMVEQCSDDILHEAKTENISFLVVGDPFGATTHTDLVLRAIEKNIPYKVIHNASILNAIGCCGLQLYNFGETVSVVFWTDTWRPTSFFDKICANKSRGLHTLCLLDIKVKEQSIENLLRGRKVYEPPRYMSVAEAAKQFLEIVDDSEKNPDKVMTRESPCIGVARVGSDTQQVVAGTLEQLGSSDLGDPLHSLIVCGNLHPLELAMLRHYAIDASVFKE